MKKKFYTFGIFSCLIIGTVKVHAQAGALDPAFGTGGKVTTDLGGDDYVFSVAIQSDGKIVGAGISYNGTDNDFAIVRYNGDGTLDNTFSTDGKVTLDFGGNNDFAYAVAVQSDGKIIVAGSSGPGWASFDFIVARFNSDGTLDNTFDIDGFVTTDFGTGSNDQGHSVAIQSDGKIVAGGSSNSNFALVRYNTNGNLDNTFDTDGKVISDFAGGDDSGNSIAVQSDGKIVLAGTAYVAANNDFAVVRYNSNGSLDNTFDTDGKVTTDFGVSSDDVSSSLAIQGDGKIVVTGHSNGAIATVRYNSIGALDNTFDTDGKVTTDFGISGDWGNAVAIQSDGKIVVAGTTGNWPDGNFVVVRYNSDGTPDNTFDTDGIVTTDIGGTTDDYGQTLALQTDWKIVVAGNSNNFGGPNNISVVRYMGSCTPVAEICNGMDDNCNGVADDGLTAYIFYADNDDDNFGDLLSDTTTCLTEIPGFVSDSTDCDDTNPAIYPGAPETLNGVDDNCNEIIDEGVAINNIELSKIIIYPNPANNIIQISTPDFSQNPVGALLNADLKIVNAAGQIIYSGKIISSQTEIDISKFSSGLYFINIFTTSCGNTATAEINEKFIKE